MRKFLIVVLTVSMVFIFMGCGNTEENQTENNMYDEEVELEGYSQEDAQMIGGYFIQNVDNRYIQLARGCNLDDRSQGSFVTCDITEYPDVPVVHEGETIVLFTESDIDVNKNRTAFNVLQEGYTIPMYYDNTYDHFDMPDYYGEFYEETIDNIDGVDMETFMQNNAISAADFCKAEGQTLIGKRGCNSKYLIQLLPFDEIKDVNVGYYDGSTYNEITLQSSFKYFAYDGCSDNDDGEYFRGNTLPIELTKEGYAIVDVSSLPAGTYIIREKDDDYYIHDYTLTNSDESYVFQKKED